MATDLLAPLERDAGIYCARPNVIQTLPVLPQFATPERSADASLPTRLKTEPAGLPAALHIAALERTVPASVLVDDEQTVIHLSPSVGRFILLSAGLLYYIPQEDQEQVCNAIRAAIEAKTIFELEHRVRRMDGTIGWTVSRAIPVLDEGGNLIEWFESASEVIAYKRAEDALRDSEERLRQFGEASQDVLWIRDGRSRGGWRRATMAGACSSTGARAA